MFLVLLTYLTCCAREGIQVNFVDSDYADFDITYVRKEKITDYWYGTYYKDVTYSTTYKNRGWFVVFREYTNGKPGSLHFVKGSNNGVADYDDIHFETITSVDPVTGYLNLCFNITNNGDEPKRIDVGVFADIQVAGNDYATVIPLENRRGFTMTDPNTGITFTLLVKDASGTTNVDAFYYGKFESSWANIYDDYYGNQVVNYYPEKFPYFWNMTTTTDLENEDSVFAFSWQKRDIYPGKTLSYGTTVGTGANLKSPPFVKWTCDFKDNYDPNEKVTVTFSIGDYDEGERIYVYGQDDKTTKLLTTFNVYNSPTVKSYSLNVILGSNPTYSLKIYAIDSNNWKSNILEKTFLVTSKPTITITNQLDKTYKSNSLIYVEGNVKDKTSVKIGYRFDDSFTNYDDTTYFCEGYEMKYSSYIPIDSTLQAGTHTLYVFAENSYGVRSVEASVAFELIISTAPSIKNVKLSNAFAQPGEKIYISGLFKDTDSSDAISFSAQFGSGSFKYLGEIAANGRWQKFNFSYIIPKDAELKDYKITICGKDKSGNPSNDASVTVTVYLPSITPQITPLSTPLSTPFTTALQTPASTAHTTPFTTAIETPFSTAIQTPASTHHITPFSTAIETPASTAFRTESSTAFETPFQSNFQTVVETPFETAYQTPELTVQETLFQTAEQTVFETPFETVYQTVFETPFETVYQTVSSTPFETELETPFETAFNTMEETPFSTPYVTKFETFAETPFISPFETNAQTAYETPIPTVFDTPYQTSSETPFETAVDTPYNSPFQTLVPTKKETPGQTPQNTPGSTFYQTPYETVGETVYQTPFTTPFSTFENTVHETLVETQKETPFNTQDETPYVTFQPTPFETQQETPHETFIPTQEQTVAETNAETAFETPFTTPVNSPVTPVPTSTPNEENHSMIYNTHSSIMQDASSLKNRKNKNMLLIIVICCCVLIAIIAAAIIAAILIHRKNANESDEEESAVEMEETVITPQVATDTITLDNPLFTTSINDESEDIFANEFEESNPVHYFFEKENE